jgi:hypothetical protein
VLIVCMLLAIGIIQLGVGKRRATSRGGAMAAVGQGGIA